MGKQKLALEQEPETQGYTCYLEGLVFSSTSEKKQWSNTFRVYRCNSRDSPKLWQCNQEQPSKDTCEVVHKMLCSSLLKLREHELQGLLVSR